MSNPHVDDGQVYKPDLTDIEPNADMERSARTLISPSDRDLMHLNNVLSGYPDQLIQDDSFVTLLYEQWTCKCNIHVALGDNFYDNSIERTVTITGERENGTMLDVILDFDSRDIGEISKVDLIQSIATGYLERNDFPDLSYNDTRLTMCTSNIQKYIDDFKSKNPDFKEVKIPYMDTPTPDYIQMNVNGTTVDARVLSCEVVGAYKHHLMENADNKAAPYFMYSHRLDTPDNDIITPVPTVSCQLAKKIFADKIHGIEKEYKPSLKDRIASIKEKTPDKSKQHTQDRGKHTQQSRNR